MPPSSSYHPFLHTISPSYHLSLIPSLPHTISPSYHLPLIPSLPHTISPSYHLSFISPSSLSSSTPYHPLLYISLFFTHPLLHIILHFIPSPWYHPFLQPSYHPFIISPSYCPLLHTTLSFIPSSPSCIFSLYFLTLPTCSVSNFLLTSPHLFVLCFQNHVPSFLILPFLFLSFSLFSHSNSPFFPPSSLPSFPSLSPPPFPYRFLPPSLPSSNPLYDTSINRAFLWSFHLPGEAQKIDRIMEIFAGHYLDCNPGGVLDNTDTAYILSYSVIMLHTSLYNPSVKDKPDVDRFVIMNRGINNGGDLPREFLAVSLASFPL